MSRRGDILALAVFATLLAMCGVVLFVLEQDPLSETVTLEDGSVAERVIGSGRVHPGIPEMQVGGDGARRHANLFWPGALFLGLQVVFFGGALCLGMSRRGARGQRFAIQAFGGIAAGTALLLVVVVGIFSSYRSLLEDVAEGAGTTAMFLGFPVSSAWLVYGLWLVPVVFVVVFARTFRSWYYPEASREAFRRLRADREGGDR